MRTQRMAATAAVLVALATVSACQSGGSGGAGAGGGGSKDSALPSAGTMAEIEAFVAQRTTCRDLHLKAEDPEAESVGSEWGVKERGICWDAKGMGITLLSVDNMKQFQTRAKQRGGGYFMGKDFAIRQGRSAVEEGLKGSGLLYLSCKADAAIPSGYKKEPSLVDGCVLTDHFG
ncbi:hypothetical protein ACFYXH_35860 [Streptomyces sp. NPDC002730]|uniref:hypothetical protein n=1 Tax=Streptomyces sp. NPDC002730 TaxID=3364662 RepID=UPI0036C34722